MQLNTISIENFKRLDLSKAIAFGNDMLISSQIEHFELFKYPCRIDGITILICLRGKIECNINLKRYCVEENTVLVNFQENIIQILDAEDVEAYALVISSDYINDLQMSSRQRSDFYMAIKETVLVHVPYEEIACLKHYYVLLRHTAQHKPPLGGEIIKGIMQGFIYNIISLMQGCVSANEGNPQLKGRAYHIFESFMDLLTRYHTRERTVKFYAGKMCLTANYLSSTVKLYSGKTAMEWINEYVILEAKTLLKYSGMSIQEVAYRLNFPTQSAFGKYFKVQTGMNPKRYKNTP